MSTTRVHAALALQPHERGPALLDVVEDQWFDRKSSRITPQALANLEVGFGNADGGTIVIGLADGQVQGTDADPRRRNELMQAAVDLTEPPVRARSRFVACINRQGAADHLLVVEVEPSTIVHTNQRDEVFLRV